MEEGLGKIIRIQIMVKSRLFASLRLSVFALDGRGVPRGDELNAHARAEKGGRKGEDTAGAIGY